MQKKKSLDLPYDTKRPLLGTTAWLQETNTFNCSLMPGVVTTFGVCLGEHSFLVIRLLWGIV